MIPDLVEWQKYAPNELVYPWWTHPFLDVLEKWDMKNKNFLELGCGLGTAWLRSRCKWVDSIDSNQAWAEKATEYCNKNSLFNGLIYCKELSDGVQGLQESYFGLIPDEKYDIISVDGIFRTEALEWAVNHFKDRSGIVIADNLDQDFVWISPKAHEIMKPFKEHIFIQPNHTNHEGKPWNTRYWIIE